MIACLLLFASLYLSQQIFAQANHSNPILVLGAAETYAGYTGEILKAEGFNEFDIVSSTGKIKLADLKKYDLVLLTRQSLSAKQSDMFLQFVREGGNLIAFCPDKKMESLFGISISGEPMNDPYIIIHSSNNIGKGLLTQSLQIHGITDVCTLITAKAIASLFNKKTPAIKYPALVANNFGKGHAIAFLYNLPQSVAYTRQGNPRYAGQEMDGITGLRAMDLFTNGWIDTTKNTLNQADEQMHLLSNVIEEMNSYNKPLPRLWYFPGNLKCLVTLNNDGEDTKEADYAKQFTDVDAKGAKMTLYIKEVDFTTKEWVHHWKNKGFEMAAHYDNTMQATNPDWKTMDSVYKDLNEKMKTSYGIDSIKTVVNHWFVWCGNNAKGEKDFTAQAKIEEQNGILLDANYAHYDNGANQGHFLGPFGINQGNYTGSGLPMKFTDEQGGIINVYQHFNGVYDQQYMEHDDKDGFYNCFKGLVDRSIDSGIYSFVSVKAHNAEYFFSEKPLMKMLDYANSKKIPVWTELKLLEFLKAKEAVSFTDIEWKNNVLSFSIQSLVPDASQLTCMIPAVYNGRKIDQIVVDEKITGYTIEAVKGSNYAFLPFTPGTNLKVVVSYFQ